MDTDETAEPGARVHSYSRDFVSAYIYGLLALLALAIYWLISLASLPSALSIGPLISITIFGILHFIFDQWAWRFLCLIPGLGIVDLRGVYKGKLRPGGTGDLDATFTIKQSWSRLSIHMECDDLSSNSFSAAFTKNRIKADEIELVYNYAVQNQCAKTGEVTLAAHDGTAMLKVLNKGRELQGEYFTRPIPSSWGKISINRTQTATR